MGARRKLPVGRASLTIARIVALSIGLAFSISQPTSAQYIRGPSIANINVGPRIPNMAPNPNPTTRYLPNIIEGDPSGSSPGTKQSNSIGTGPVRRAAKKTAASGPVDDSFVVREVVVEIEGVVTDLLAEAIGRRHRITRLELTSLSLVGSTLVRWRIPDSRSVGAVVRELVADNTIKSAQPNYRFTLQEDLRTPAEGDPAQYALAKLHLQEAHQLTRGEDIAIAIIDSGIDAGHPELVGTIAVSYDVLDSKEGPHPHGTGIAAVVASHARLVGGAPAAKIVAIRAFGVSNKLAESTSFILIRSFDFAIAHGARIINMSFAGPQDPLLAKGLAAAAAKGIVLVAAAGNAGPKSPPLFPAGDRHVIAVAAVDSADKIFAASNRGGQIALSAPGVDILTAAPDSKYQVISGTSFAAAYVSGVAALVMARNPALAADDVRAILTRTAKDLGVPGRDDVFGAGELDALAAVNAAVSPVASASDRAANPSGSDLPGQR